MKRQRERRCNETRGGEEEEVGRRVNKIFRKLGAPGVWSWMPGGVCSKWWSGTAGCGERGTLGVGSWSDVL